VISVDRASRRRGAYAGPSRHGPSAPGRPRCRDATAAPLGRARAAAVEKLLRGDPSLTCASTSSRPGTSLTSCSSVLVTAVARAGDCHRDPHVAAGLGVQAVAGV